MKQILKSALMILVVLVCATSLAFASGDKVRKQKHQRKGDGYSYQTTLDTNFMLSAKQNRKRGGNRDRSCQTTSLDSDGRFMLAGNGNGNGGSGANGGNGSGGTSGEHDCDSSGDGPGPGPGAGNGPGDGDCDQA